MFNLGYKEVVLNKLGDVKADKGVLTIPGYGKFEHSNLSNIKKTPAEAAKGEVSTYAVVPPAGIQVGEAVNVTVNIDSMRQKGSQARDFIKHGKKVVFQSMPLTAVTADAIAKAIADGFKAFVANNMQSEFTFGMSFDAKAKKLGIQIYPGFEDNTVKYVQISRTAPSDNLPIILAKTVTTKGNEGVGLGKFIEESRRMATAANVMPYAQSHGGNDQGIDVRGKYTTFVFDYQGENAGNGWESHDYVDHAYVNAAMHSKPAHYVIYANEADAKLIAEIEKVIKP